MKKKVIMLTVVLVAIVSIGLLWHYVWPLQQKTTPSDNTRIPELSLAEGQALDAASGLVVKREARLVYRITSWKRQIAVHCIVIQN